MTVAQDEAFALWLQVWAPAYEEDSSASDVLHHIHDTYFLVNVVDNDFMQCVRRAFPGARAPVAPRRL